MRRRRAGFTIVELLTVMILIGVLASIAILKYIDLRHRARASAAAGDLQAVRIAAYSAWYETGSWAGEVGPGMVPPGLVQYLPQNFSFNRPEYTLDWENFVPPGGGPTDEIVDEMIGFGPIEPLLKDPTINDILINTHKQCFVERFGKLEKTTVHFKDEAHLLRIIQKIVAGVGRRVDESSPTVDARLPDGSRVNVAIRPIAVDGPLVSIRKFSKRPFSMDRLVEIGALRPQMADLLQAAVKGRDFTDHLRRNRQRQDDAAECAFELHSGR